MFAFKFNAAKHTNLIQLRVSDFQCTGRCTSFASPMLGACTKTSTCRVAKLVFDNIQLAFNKNDPTWKLEYRKSDSFEASGRKVKSCCLVSEISEILHGAAAFWLSFCFFFSM